MKIIRARAWVENLALTRPYSIAYATFDHVQNLFVEIETENGLLGLGSGSPVEAITGETMAMAEAALAAHLEEVLIGRDCRQLRRILRGAEQVLAKTPAALATVDVALHDLYARRLGLPLVELLGREHERLPTSVTIGIKDSTAEAVAEALEHVGGGFRILKLKTGLAWERDLETVAKVREAVGPGVRLRVDANQGYDAAALGLFLAGAGPLGIEFVEQPLPPEQLEVMRGLPAEVRARCAADENLHDPEDALHLAATPQPFGIYNIKLMKCGGIRPSLRIAGIAELAGVELMWGCMDESRISIAGALHAALACPATRYLDLDGSFDLARDLVKGGFELEDGFLSTTDAPGLGVELV